MIRITIQTDNANMAVNVGGHVLSTLKTFILDAPELEAYLRVEMLYQHRQIIGYEIVE